jgi:hypothetical protein
VRKLAYLAILLMASTLVLAETAPLAFTVDSIASKKIGQYTIEQAKLCGNFFVAIAKDSNGNYYLLALNATMENPASQPITAPPNTVTFYDIASSQTTSQTISDAQLQTTPKANVTYTLSCDASKDALYIIPYRAKAVYKDKAGNYYQLQVAEMFIYNITTGKFSSTVLAGEEQNAGTTAPTSLLNYPAATSVEEGLGVLAFQYYDGTNYYAYINTTKVSTKGPTAVTNALSSKLTTIEAVGFPEAVVVKFSDGSNDYYALVKSDGTVSTSPQVNGFNG